MNFIFISHDLSISYSAEITSRFRVEISSEHMVFIFLLAVFTKNGTDFGSFKIKSS